MNCYEKMLPEHGNWYKGNLHSHTTASDGRLTPAEAVLYYKKNGYSFMCLSEHDLYTDRRGTFDTEDFILLPGLEASAYLIDSECLRDIYGHGSKKQEELNRQIDQLKTGMITGVDLTSNLIATLFQLGLRPKVLKTHHIHGILGNKKMQENAGMLKFSKEEKYPCRIYLDTWDGLAVAQQLSDELKEKGCFTTYNHPIWSRVDVSEVKDLTGIWAIECYNYDTVNECSEGYDTVFWDAMLRSGNDIYGFASDDNHNGDRFPDSFGGYVNVKADALDHESIVNSLLDGNYYFSSGATITQWGIKDDSVYVCCEGAERINFICGGFVGASYTIMSKDGIPLTYAEYPLKGQEEYVRVEVIDYNHKKAWTNAVRPYGNCSER